MYPIQTTAAYMYYVATAGRIMALDTMRWNEAQSGFREVCDLSTQPLHAHDDDVALARRTREARARAAKSLN